LNFADFVLPVFQQLVLFDRDASLPRFALFSLHLVHEVQLVVLRELLDPVDDLRLNLVHQVEGVVVAQFLFGLPGRLDEHLHHAVLQVLVNAVHVERLVLVFVHQDREHVRLFLLFEIEFRLLNHLFSLRQLCLEFDDFLPLAFFDLFFILRYFFDLVLEVLKHLDGDHALFLFVDEDLLHLFVFEELLLLSVLLGQVDQVPPHQLFKYFKPV